MSTRWILLISLLSLTLGSCGGSPQAAIGKPPDLAPLDPPSQNPTSDSSKSGPSLPQLPAPTIGSVVITNTTETPISSTLSASALTSNPILESLAQRARQDLANRLKINVNQIDFLFSTQISKLLSRRYPRLLLMSISAILCSYSSRPVNWLRCFTSTNHRTLTLFNILRFTPSN